MNITHSAKDEDQMISNSSNLSVIKDIHEEKNSI